MRLLHALLNFALLALASPESYPPWQKPHCKHPSAVSCCQSFFTGNNPPPGLGVNLACLDLGPSDLQCVYCKPPYTLHTTIPDNDSSAETTGKDYDYCVGTWACYEIDVLTTVGIHCTSPADGGACGGLSVVDCTNVAVRWPSCLWGPSPDIGANAVNNVLGDTVVDRIHDGGKPSGPLI